jgi:hypothetical protein
MNSIDSILQRLCRAAAHAPRDLPAEAPFPLEARILAQWRAGASETPALLCWPVVRGAFVCACAIVVISTVLSLRSLTDAPSNEMVIVDSMIQLTLMP